MCYFRNVIHLHMEMYISKGTGKLGIIRILENPFYYKHLHLFCLLTVRLLFEDIAPSGLTASVYLWGLPSPPSLPCGSNRRLSQVSICWKWDGWFVSFRGLVELCLQSLCSTSANLETLRSPMSTKRVQSSLFWISSE